MEKIFRVYDGAILKISRAAAVVSGVFILAVAFIVCYEIVMRGLFNSPTEWSLEVSTYLVIAAGFLGLAVTLRQRGHIQVDFLVEKFSPKTRCILEILTTAVSIMLFYIFTSESAGLVETSFAFNKLSPSILRFPLWVPQTALAVGSALLFLELIRQLFEDVIAILKNDFSAFLKKGGGD